MAAVLETPLRLILYSQSLDAALLLVKGFLQPPCLVTQLLPLFFLLNLPVGQLVGAVDQNPFDLNGIDIRAGGTTIWTLRNGLSNMRKATRGVTNTVCFPGIHVCKPGRLLSRRAPLLLLIPGA